MQASVINFTPAPDSRGRKVVNGYGPQTFHIEFPTVDAPEWILNEGIVNCWRLQQYPGLEHLSFSNVLTAFEVKCQQYVGGVVNNIRDSINGDETTRNALLVNVKRVRTFGKSKNHISLLDSAGKEVKRIFYNMILTNEVTKEFLPREGGVVAMPPSDFAYAPKDIPLLEVDYDLEAEKVGEELHGRKEGIVMKVPEYIAPSLQRLLSANVKPGDTNPPKRTGGNATVLNEGRGSENETTDNREENHEESNEAGNYGENNERGNWKVVRGNGRRPRNRGSYNRRANGRIFSNNYYHEADREQGGSTRGRGTQRGNRARGQGSGRRTRRAGGRRGNPRPYQVEYTEYEEEDYDSNQPSTSSAAGYNRGANNTYTRGRWSTRNRRGRGARNARKSRSSYRGGRSHEGMPAYKRHPYKKLETEEYYECEEAGDGDDYNYYENEEY